MQEQEKSKKSTSVVSTGVTSLITVFAVLLLSSFSLLILSNSRTDTELSQRTAQAVTNYYLADAIAEEEISELVALRNNSKNYNFSQFQFIVISSGFVIANTQEYNNYEGFVVTFNVDIDENKMLVVDVGLPESGSIPIERLKWQTVAKEDPLQEETIAE